uniref:Uncharacterized protein n=1 Tax=Panagrolaimus sp. ES5 TaxID=591445 RepID=A0AC34EZ49_9BILA
MTKIVLREKKLLEEARENYKLLKERFVLIQAENEQLKNGFEKNIEAVREEREMLLNEIDEAKIFITNIISNIEIEQQNREELFDEFKKTTITDLQNVYQDQLEQLTAELSEFDIVLNQNNTDNEKLSKQCTNLMKQLTALENDSKNREISMKEKYEMQLAELSRKLREFHKGDEKGSNLSNDLQMSRIENATLKDDIAKLKKDKTTMIEQKESELRKVRDELFTVSREKMESEIAKKRLNAEIETLKKSSDLGVQRERILRNEISKLEKDKMELYSQIRNKDFTKESEIAEATAHMEAQIQTLEKRLQDMMLTVRALQKEKESFHKIETENQNLKEKLKNESHIFDSKIHEMDYRILQQKRENDEKLRQLEFERDHAEKRANDVITKSKASIYLTQIEKLKEDLQNKDDEIVQIKSHYRSLLSKMKRAVEKVEEKRECF